MAKERKRGNREVKKPKRVVPKPAGAAPSAFTKGLSPNIGKPKKT